MEGSKINEFTDRKALIYLNNQPKITAKLARRVSCINLFGWSIKNKESALNKVSDGLSTQLSKDSFISRDKILPERPRINFHLNYLEDGPLLLPQGRFRVQTLCATE